MRIDRYMSLCLAHPRYGYYRRGTPIGKTGDFITAPEVSQMFGELIGLWCAAVWERMGRPAPAILVELGPGRGTLMADALRAARAVPAFCRAVSLHLVETNETLRRAQRTALDGAAPAWHDGLETVPRGPLLAIANEFLDALPIRQFQRAESGWRERVVTVDEGGGALRFGLAADASAASGDLGDLPLGTIVERSPAREAVAALLAERVRCSGGAALIVDYGPARPGAGDTLQAVRRHRFHDVLREPGDADLTAHLDFAALARAARRAGAEAHGPVAQRCFLRALGIDARAARLRRNPDRAAEVEAQRRRLTAPDEMGTLFKAFAIADPALGPPPGFERAHHG